MAGKYGDLTEAEQAHWNEYTNLRGIADWPGFDDAQDQRRADSRTWLQDRRAYIKDLAEGNVEGQKAGWDTANRKSRYDFLADSNLNAGAPKHEVRLPCSGQATDAEKSYIEEREVYLVFASTTDEQKARKQANVDWLVNQRKKLWHLMQDDPSKNEGNDRQARYDNLCIATHYGSAYEAWDKAHNKYGEPYSEDDDSGKGRSWCVSHAKSYAGVHENPDGSNKGKPEPSDWQKRTIGYDGVPWCACFTSCMAWDAGVSGSSTAAVQNNINMAKQGQGIYSGYTTDRSRVHSGDHVAIGCSSCHIEVVADPPDSSGVNTVGGNTSKSGSQYNGGEVVAKRRSNSEIVGYLLVRF